jgi:hypothetical protein
VNMSLGCTVLTLVVYTLAIMRVTRLINADTILDKLRLAIAQKMRQHHDLADKIEGDTALDENASQYYRQRERRWSTLMYFVQCPWCVSMWLALATAWIPLWFNTNVVARYVGIALATSHLVGICARFADTEEIDYEDETVD